MNEIADTFLKDFGGIVISALIFVVSFLWKDLLSDIEQIYFPTSKGLGGRVLYIGLVTFSILTFVIFLRKILRLEQQNQTTGHGFDDSPYRSTLGDPTDLGEIGDLGNSNGSD